MKQRRPILAALLSLVTPGLGQLYNTHHTKAIVLYGCALVFYPLLSLSGIR